MRLRRLDLIRYGHFTDCSFDFLRGESDFHILFGRNEAGKSTALAAIEDMLFGFPKQSPYGFTHEYSEMRVGAVLENGGESLEVVRRKGVKDTLLSPAGFPHKDGESMLASYLSDADRSFFKRMFSLDHSRLRRGGREILEVGDDVGQLLFSAGMGINGIQRLLSQLSSEADGLWAPRRSKYRQYYIAEKKFTEAQEELRRHVLTASQWRDLKRAYDEAEGTYARLCSEREKKSAECNRLVRIRRVYSDVRRKQELDSQLKNLKNVVELPENFKDLLATAESKEREFETRISICQEQLARAREKLKGLSFDEPLLQREADVAQLHERWIEIRGEKADLPKQQAELHAAEINLQTDARELGWKEKDSEALMQRIPTGMKVKSARILHAQWGELRANIESAARRLDESRKTRDELQLQLEQLQLPADVSMLAHRITALRQKGDLEAQVQAGSITYEAAKEKVRHRLQVLHPRVDIDCLANGELPARAEVQDFLERQQDRERRSQQTDQQTASVRHELDGAEAAHEQIVQNEQVVTRQKLKEERGRRDALWNLVKSKFVLNESVAEERYDGFEQDADKLPDSFESAIVNADDIADRRFDCAEAVGRISEIKRKIGDLNIQHRLMLDRKKKLEKEGDRQNAQWKSMWKAAPFEPLSPEKMLEWLDRRDILLEAIDEQNSALPKLKRLRDDACHATERLISGLADLGVDVSSMDSESLNVIIERAGEEVSSHKEAANKKSELEDGLNTLSVNVKEALRELRAAEKNREKWQKNWNLKLCELGLAEGTAPEVVNSQIDVIGRMRETADKIRKLKNGMDRIHRDIADFEQLVSELAENVAVDLADHTAEDAVFLLKQRIKVATGIQESQESTNVEIAKLAEQADDLNRNRRKWSDSISSLMEVAKVDTKEALTKAIERSSRKLSFLEEQKNIMEKLIQGGDGKSPEDLEEECENLDIDEVIARLESYQKELDVSQKQLTDAIAKRIQARSAYDAVGGDGKAARIAARKQEAIIEMQEASEKYIKLKTSVRLLQWAIDRFRQEKQAPLLKRTGELFETGTVGSFSGLEVYFDENDKAHLMGVRPSGDKVSISGLSSGTVDQLYLSLRIAAIEEYLEPSATLPFIADDLFINFDDERAAAGFELLAELSRKTQILFFTHHAHLVDIARETLGPSVSFRNFV